MVFRLRNFFIFSLFTLCRSEGFFEKVAENRPPLNLDFIGGVFSPFTSIVNGGFKFHHLKGLEEGLQYFVNLVNSITTHRENI